MARGYGAQAGGDLVAARAAFELALSTRPGDAQATAALTQIDADQKLSRLTSIQAAASELEQAERWAEAARRYEEALAADPNLAEAREGRERAGLRADLDQRLRREIDNADRFNDDAVLNKARELLETARAVSDPGPVLSRQVAELDGLLKVAMTPVQVTIESDNLTQVTLFKVGRLGAFVNKTLELRPGAYTAVGSRPGFRDVRRNFRVRPDEGSQPVVVRCEDPI
jgi:tetratricopeptide (TPR) repeat protein